MAVLTFWLTLRRSQRRKMLKRRDVEHRRAIVALLLIGQRWWSV